MIYLIRHGLDDERFIGGYSEVSLVDEGINQIRNAREFIIKSQIKIDKIYCSDVVRAKESALIINDKLKKKIIYDTRLRELDKGLMTGLEKENAYLIYPEFKNLTDINKRYPKGETIQDLYHRVYNFISIFKEDDVLLVTHRGFINMIYYFFNDIELDMDKEKFDVTHASIHEMDIKLKKIKRIY